MAESGDTGTTSGRTSPVRVPAGARSNAEPAIIASSGGAGVAPQRGHSARNIARLLGPAFVAAIAYVDPGNVAANISAGAGYGYLLLWVLVLANAMAVLVQYLSAKLGLVTGKSLPELLGGRMRRGPRLAFWVQAEIVAAATDLAEVIGGALALNILFGLPLLAGGIVIGAISMLLLVVQSRGGQRWFEYVIIGLLCVITVGFMAGLLVSPVDWSEAAGGLIPRFAGSETVLLAASMLGATVMPHAIYLHSALVRDRHGRDVGSSPRLFLKATRWDVVLGLFVAGGVNIAMVLLAASALRGVPGTDTIEGAAAAISAHLGPAIGVIFAVGLLASGLASTSVGCYAGATIMDGLLHVRIPLLARRAITLVPALLILFLGIDPTRALVLSQVLLSLGIPFAAIPLVWLTSRRRLMGEFVNSIVVRALAVLAVGLIVTLNIVLVVLTLQSGV